MKGSNTDKYRATRQRCYAQASQYVACHAACTASAALLLAAALLLPVAQATPADAPTRNPAAAPTRNPAAAPGAVVTISNRAVPAPDVVSELTPVAPCCSSLLACTRCSSHHRWGEQASQRPCEAGRGKGRAGTAHHYGIGGTFWTVG